MSKKPVIVIVLLLALLATVGLVSAQQGQLPGSGWFTGQQIQNVGDSNATISFNAYNNSGQIFPCGQKPAVPGASVNFLTTVDCQTLSPGFVGSAVVSSDQPIAAIVNVVNMPSGRAAGMYRGTDGSDVALQIAFPLLKNNYFGRSTALYIQNASSNVNDINVTVKVGANNYTKSFNDVPAYAMVVVGPADTTPALPNGAVGSATVNGSQPLAGTALEYEGAVAIGNNLHAYTAFVPQDFAAKVYCPLIRNKYANLNTGIQAQNVSGAAQTIKISYSYRVNGQGALLSKEVTSPSIQPGGSHTFFTPTDLAANPGAVGSATVQGMGGGNIAVIVNDETFTLNPNRVTAYTCFPDNAATKTQEVAVPLFKEFYLGDTSGIQVQNVGNGNATITISYFAANKPEVKFSTPATVPAGASFTFYGVSGGGGLTLVSGTPNTLLGTAGGVVITANQPIVAIVNEEPAAGAGRPASTQDAKLYEGFNQ